jgi:DsbC/DsbD-like thiol-disulfide interchange protein
LSGNSWPRNNGFALPALGICVLLVLGCDIPSPAKVQSDRPSAADQGQPPAAPAQSAPAKSPSEAAAKTDSAVTASAVADPLTARVGETFTIRVDVQIESGWHIYAIDRPTGPSVPTSINFELPKSLAWDGDWTGPEPRLDDANPQEPSFIYEGSVAFSRQVRVARDAHAGLVSLRGSFHYQACNKFSCRAPAQLPIQAEIKIDPRTHRSFDVYHYE